MTSRDQQMLGQFIPLHYHFQMLADKSRMTAFQYALAQVVPPGGRVLELGSGTGALSFFAAQDARQVIAVEYNPALVEASRRLLAKNGVADRVTVVQADAGDWVPDEPVDVVICEMLHSALLREKQIDVIRSFKAKYLQRFGTLPRFVPEATLLMAQPVQQDYRFHGYEAPVPFFQAAVAQVPGCEPLADGLTYATIDYAEALPDSFAATLRFEVNKPGQINAVRFVTKNLLAILLQEQRSIDWYNQHLVMPLPSPLDVQAGQVFELSFSYPAGGEIELLDTSLSGTIIAS